MESEGKKYLAIEEWKGIHATSDAVFAGVKAAQKWKPGKQVTEEEYDTACRDFRGAPVDGRDKEAKG